MHGGPEVEKLGSVSAMVQPPARDGLSFQDLDLSPACASVILPPAHLGRSQPRTHLFLGAVIVNQLCGTSELCLFRGATLGHSTFDVSISFAGQSWRVQAKVFRLHHPGGALSAGVVNQYCQSTTRTRCGDRL
jgi:hypothetical protein